MSDRPALKMTSLGIRGIRFEIGESNCVIDDPESLMNMADALAFYADWRNWALSAKEFFQDLDKSMKTAFDDQQKSFGESHSDYNINLEFLLPLAHAGINVRDNAHAIDVVQKQYDEEVGGSIIIREAVDMAVIDTPDRDALEEFLRWFKKKYIDNIINE